MGVEAARRALAVAPAGSRRALLLDDRPRPTWTRPTPRPSTRPSAYPSGPPPTTWSGRCARRSARRRWRPSMRPRDARPWSCSPSCAPVCAGGGDERQGGDGAVAFTCVPDGAVLELVGRAAATERVPRPLARARRGRIRTCGRSGSASRPTCRWPRPPSPTRSRRPAITADAVDHLIVTGLHARAVTRRHRLARRPPSPRWRRTTARPSATSVPPTSASGWPTCSSGPTPGR